jgi:hypothetical protein
VIGNAEVHLFGGANWYFHQWTGKDPEPLVFSSAGQYGPKQQFRIDPGGKEVRHAPA